MAFLRQTLVLLLLLIFGSVPAARLALSQSGLSLQSLPAQEQTPSEEKVITLVTLEWPPYVGQNLPSTGYVHELVLTALDRAGYKARVRFVPWARALREVRYGEADALFPGYYSESRNQYAAFSDPFPGGPIGFYKRSDSPVEFRADSHSSSETALRQLQEYTIGVVRGYVNIPLVDNADFLKKEPASNDISNLRRLYYKRVDLIVIDRFVADYLLNTQLSAYRDELEFMEPPIEIKNLYVAFSRQDPDYREKLEAFNRGLASMKEDGTLQSIYEKHGVGAVLEYEMPPLTGFQQTSPAK